MLPHVERVYGAWDDEAQERRFHASTDPASHEIIELDGEPVGCEWVRRHPDCFELVRIYLMPVVQGRGIGTALVERLLAKARRAGLPARLRVLRANPARRLYERLGFVVTRETATHDYMETNAVRLRPVHDDDLAAFFEQLQNKDAIHMAAFTSRDPTNRDAFKAHWKRLRGDDRVTVRTILFDGAVAGHVASFVMAGELEVAYWIGRDFWGKNIATRALARFLNEVTTARPIHARVATDNVASLRVLEKCGFTITGEERGFANARGEEIEEFVLRLG